MLTTPASLPVASPLPSALPLDEFIGEIAAGAAVALARALRYQNDGPSFRNASSSLLKNSKSHWRCATFESKA
jgi:hypothetical protein